MAKATITKFGLQAGTESTLFAVWAWPPSSNKKGSTAYYKKYTGSSTSIITALKAVGEKDTSLNHRKKIASLNGISKYKSTASQNSSLLKKLKSGKLIKSKSGSSSSSISGTDHYEIKWEKYVSKNKQWFTISKEDTKEKQATCDIPDNADKVRFTVKPVAKTEKKTTTDKKGKKTTKERPKWKASSTSKTYDVVKLNPSPIASFALDTSKLKDYKIIAQVSGITSDMHTTHVEFNAKRENDKYTYKSGNIPVSNLGLASYTFGPLLPGKRYAFKARGYNSKSKTYGEWTEWSYVNKMIPAMQGRPFLKMISSTSVYVSWYKDSTVDEYEIQYTKDIEYFNGTGSVSSVVIKDPNITNCTVEGLDTSDGKNVFYFRVISRNELGETVPTGSNIGGIVIGLAPEAPTTWSSSTTAIVGEEINLYWVHNSKDGSHQTEYSIRVFLEDGTLLTNLKGETSLGPDEEETIYSVSFITGNYPAISAGSKLTWQVATRGAYEKWSPWSMLREIDVYAQPTLTFNVIDANGDDIHDTKELTAFPISIDALAQPSTQAATGYSIEIFANEAYDTIDKTGSGANISADQRIFNKYYPAESNVLNTTISAGDVILQNGISYTLKAKVAMSSGLTAEYEDTFEVALDDDNSYLPGATVIPRDDYSCVIHPYCYDLNMDVETVSVYEFTETEESKTYCNSMGYTHSVGPTVLEEPDPDAPEVESTTITSNSNIIEFSADVTEHKLTLINCENFKLYCDVNEDACAQAYISLTGTDNNGNAIEKAEFSMFFSDENSALIDLSRLDHPDISKITMVIRIDGWSNGVNDVSSDFSCTFDDGGSETELNKLYSSDVELAVYRREYDGTLTEIQTGISNATPTYVVDPHPALDYARYRIVATDTVSGTMGFADIPEEPMGIKSIIIQWDEEWSSYEDPTNSSEMPDDENLHSGSVLVLPYDIDIQDTNDVDVTLVNYIGRRHPVSYYGTQLGHKATWNTTIPKNDTETIYMLRRLAIWQGDVYVREPSGTGYWAQISVSFDLKHCELTVPVTLNLTRVDGGK